MADKWAKKGNNEVEDPIESAELECVAYLHDMLGDVMWEDHDACSQFIQDGTAAFVANSPGKGKRGKGKGKFGTYPVRPSSLSIEDRRKKLAELKSKTECRDCGRRGHWSGDKQCTMKKTAHLSFADGPSSFTGVASSSSLAGEVSFPQIPSFPLLRISKVFEFDDGPDSERVMLVATHNANSVQAFSSSSSGRTVVKTEPFARMREVKHDPDEEDDKPMDWTFPDGVMTPEGGDRRFRYGALKGISFIHVTMEHPEQFLTSSKSSHSMRRWKIM